ncbi:MAG: hypothetical protein JNK02_12170 [Planctomycetes bacterium]|nr:hypothetical protein [Planctomycetota bacterium]
MKTQDPLLGASRRLVLPALLCAAAPAAAALQDVRPAAAPTATPAATQEPAPPGPPAPPAGPQSAPRRITGGAAPSEDSFRFGSPPSLPQGLSEPDMWPAATAEGWKKPVLVPFQRSFDDALQVSRATGQPILVCVNMDGEIASEHWAGVRYRDPATAKLFEPYVCIAASVYRHTPRDHDEEGRRVVCPRLGSMTCGEHITAETELYEKYFEGLRISPRHIALDLTGQELYDVYFSWDTQTVTTALVKGIEHLPPGRPLSRDLPLAERALSPDVADREAIEAAYVAGTPEARRALLTTVLERRAVDQNDLLRLAIFGLDRELARLARAALARSETEGAVDLIAEALKVPLADDERALLLEAAARLAAKFPRAGTLTAVHQGLAQTSTFLDARRFTEIEYATRARRTAPLDYAQSLEGRVQATEHEPADASSRLALAESLLERAEEPGEDHAFARLFAEDARAAAEAARGLGAAGWRLEAVLAATADWAGDGEAARRHALAAVEGGMLTADAKSATVHERTALRVVTLFAAARQRAIRDAYRARRNWPPEWLSDVNAAYALVARSPLSTDGHLVSFYDFLRWLGATPRANAVLDEALARFPGSPEAHDRLRARLLYEGGPAALESGYAQRLAHEPDNQDLVWYAGYAALVVAEHRRREGDAAAALVAYERGIERFGLAAQGRPEVSTTADHFAALGLAGRARLRLEAGDLERATDDILAAFERAPNAAATPDGLNITPVETAKQLRARLEAESKAELLARLVAGLDALAPELLEKRPYELEDPRQSRRRREPTPGAGAPR